MEFNDDQEERRYHSGGRNDRENRRTAGIPGIDDDRKIFIGGLSRQTTELEVRQYFSKFGEIESVTVKLDSYSGQSRGFAFIVFRNSATIEKLLASGDHYINNRKVDPKRVTKQTQPGKIFVGGLTTDMTDSEIKDYFSQWGNVLDIQRPYDKVKNQRKGFCFITFQSREVIYELLKHPKQHIGGKEVDVRKVKVTPDGTVQGQTGPLGHVLGMGRGRGLLFPQLPQFRSYDQAMASGVYGGGYGGNDQYPGSNMDQFINYDQYDGSGSGYGAGSGAGGSGSSHMPSRGRYFPRGLHH